MDLDCLLRRAELGADLLVETTGDHQLQNVMLARRERREPVLDGDAGGARFARGATRIRSVRLTATDNTGKKHKREVPFN